MNPGLYEKLVTKALAAELQSIPPELQAQQKQIDPAESPQVLTQHLSHLILRTLESVDPKQRVHLANTLIQHLLNQFEEQDETVDDRLLQLLSVQLRDPVANVHPLRPAIPLNATDLLVNARGEHRIGAELIKELHSADRVDLLCAFLKWSGFRVLRDALAKFVKSGGELRVLTTAYMGATDVEALDAISQLGTVKVSYDRRRTRLHAKAWLFHRDTGYSTAYVGSSNMSSSALQDGLEWNVRLSRTENPRVLKKFESTFESYWQDTEFERYLPQRDHQRFVSAVKEQQYFQPLHYHLDVTPYPFQAEILERLQTERELHGRWKNLVVAATGTGKTVMAGLDYQHVKSRWKRATLLFVAHRGSILEQSLRTFRAILKDGTFGELWTGQHKPTQSEHLFASVQKLANVDLNDLDPQHFDVVIVDEFHHAAAPTYDRLLAHFRPKLLLGLTATPERADGRSVLGWFDQHIAAELRLWSALERGLLCPFQYFGIHDNTDLRSVEWKNRRYVPSALESVYTGDQMRVKLIIKQLEHHLANPKQMRALGFCVGVNHARFMTAQFHAAGFNAACVTGSTSSQERRDAINALKNGDLQIIFTVDVFNEGVDVPEVDTLLLLRPTESATIFLQQLGRGLRLCKGKECLTVLDFIGYARKEFRFDKTYRALVGGSRKELQTQIQEGFPHLPSGCSMQLDREAAKTVLENVKRCINRRFLREELVFLGPDVGLGEYLERTGIELNDVYRGSKPGWMRLRHDAGFVESETRDAGLLKAIARLTHMDSVEQIEYLDQVFREDQSLQSLPTNPRQQLYLAMLHFSLWSAKEAAKPIMQKLADLWADPWALQELRALLPVLRERIDHRAWPLTEVPAVPLAIHCHYSLSEILAAFSVMTHDRPHRIREGVYYHEPSGCDLFFVTIQKNEKDYSPSTLYRDYAISQQLFHWESQSTTRADSATGLRYRSHLGRGGRALLFVRESSKDERGETRPYLFLGPGEYVGHEGERPMGVTWRLRVGVPGAEFGRLGLTG
jgi:superfamily II DNA or RNA helicase